MKHIPLLVCAVAVMASTARAQFTAAVVPPPVKAKVDTTVTQDSVHRATVALAARVTDMRKWVDSAAGAAATARDSTSLAQNGTDSSAAAAAHPVQRDSALVAHNTRVRADSASSIATVEVHDSTGLKGSSSSGTSMRSGRNRSDTRSFSNGATAPATATLLPFLAIAGLTTLIAGAALRRP